jgi:hypothetical protein
LATDWRRPSYVRFPPDSDRRADIAEVRSAPIGDISSSGLG